MYKAIQIISILIRQFILPNPYTNLIGDSIYAEIFNIVVGGIILYVLAFVLNGCAYYKGIDDPAKGSLGYLISYCYLTAIITMFGYYILSVKWFLIVFIIVYLISFIIVRKVFSKSPL